MKKIVLFLLILAALSGIFYKNVTKDAQSTPVQTIHSKKLVLKGSNTIGERFAPELAKKFLRSQGAILVHTTTGKSPVEKVVSGTFPEKKIRIDIEIFAHGSSTGFAALAEDSTDIAMSSRAIKATESENLNKQFGIVKEYPIALDALGIVVDPKNPIKTLAIEQIAGLFSGDIKNWKQLGGLDQPVKIFARDNNSGTWDTFKHLVLKPYSKSLSVDAKRFESSGELVAETVATNGGIGFVGASYISGVPVVSVSRDITGDGSLPDMFTIGTMKYALSRKLYLYSVHQKPSALAQAFVDFVNGNKGQSVASEVDLVSYFPTYDRPAIDSQASQKYQELASLGLRLTVKFSSNQKISQSTQQRDIQRLKNYIKHYPNKKFILVGQTQNTQLQWLGELFGKESLPLLDTMNIASKQNENSIEIWAI